MIDMPKFEFMLLVLSLLLLPASLLLTLTLFNVILVNSYYALSLLYLAWFLMFGAILVILNTKRKAD